MRGRIILVFPVLILFTACGSQSTQSAIATNLPTALPSPSPLPTASEIPSPVASSTPRGTVTYYRVRIEFSTTSDWSTLELLTLENILSMRVVEVTGEPTGFEANIGRLSLNQPIENAQTHKSVSMKVDYAIAPPALDQPLKFLLQKGALNGSKVRVYQVSAGEERLLQETDHRVVIEKDPGFNPLEFTADLSTLAASPPLQVRVGSGALEKLVWAFYYPWYTRSDWSSSWLKDWPLDPYASSNVSTITRHIDEAQDAGIDGFISSWWGPGSDTDRNLRKILDVAKEKDFRISIYLETLAGENGAPLQGDKIHDWLAYAISQYRDHPAYFKVDGKPLIVVWASETVPLETWKGIFAQLRAEGLDAVYLSMGYNVGNLEEFDGLHDYGVFTYPDLTQTYLSTGQAVHYYSLLNEDGSRKIWAATVQPGYDDTLQPTREGLVKDRENGDYYRFTWRAAIQSDPDWIFITTWNEWWEHTHIEPSKLYGDLYLRITREFAGIWKGQK